LAIAVEVMRVENWMTAYAAHWPLERGDWCNRDRKGTQKTFVCL